MIINIFFTILMLGLAYADIRTTKSPAHRDFKSIILTIGVLGTFVGIFVGLLDFDINSMENSIPPLLDGLKIAFYTSIVGMTLSVLISVYQRSIGYKASSTDSLEFISLQTKKLDNLDLVAQSNKDLQSAIAQLNASNTELTRSIANMTSEFLEGIEKSFSTITTTATNLDSNHESLIAKLNGLDSTIKELDFNLKKEVEKLSANFSADVINALDSLSNKYSETISVHFSENFKRFNSAVENLLSWQIEYRQSVVDSNEILKNSVANTKQFSAITDSILKRDEKTIELYKEVSGIMREYKAQNIILDEKLSAIRDLGSGAMEALKFMGEFFTELNANLKSTNEALIDNIKKSIDGVFVGVIKDFEGANKQIIADLGARDSAIHTQMSKAQNFLEELIKMMISHNKALNESYERLNKDIELHSRAISKNTSEMISEINKDGIKHLKSTTKIYFDDISIAQSKILNSMSHQITKHHEELDATLIAMSAKYLESLEQISISSVNASKDLNLINIEGVRNLNDEIAKYVRKNSDVMKDSSVELLNILEVLQKQVDIAAERTNEMQDTTRDFMVDLESSLQKASDSFKGDYEWFLRRVREIIGARL